MVYRKRYRKRNYRKRNMRRRFKRSYRYNKKGQKVFLYKRHTGVFSTLTISNISPTLAAYNFSLNDLPGVGEFTGLYDFYKINAVKISFLPQMTENISLTSVNNAYASVRFFSAIDYNDSSAPSSIDNVREYATCKTTPILREHKRIIYKPKILIDSIMSATPWLSTTTASTNYFGLKVAVEPMLSTTATSMQYNIEATYYLSFKNYR